MLVDERLRRWNIFYFDARSEMHNAKACNKLGKARWGTYRSFWEESRRRTARSGHLSYRRCGQRSNLRWRREGWGRTERVEDTTNQDQDILTQNSLKLTDHASAAEDRMLNTRGIPVRQGEMSEL